MKNLATVLLLLISSISFSQTKEESVTDLKITGISYTMDSIEELKTINWNEIKDVFINNDEDGYIKLSVGIQLKESKNKFKSSFTVKDKTKNLNILIKKAKKGVKSLIKISKKYKKQ